MNNPTTLSSSDKAKLKTLARHYGIELAILFGSRARGDARPGSDLDLGVLFKRVPSPRALYTLSAAFADLFRDDVDVVPLNFVNPELRHAVEREGQILYERTPGIFAGFAVENLHRLHQYNYLRQYDRDFLDRFLKGRTNDKNLHRHRCAKNSHQHRRRAVAAQRN
jgi:predicted nucleotidyltransferase